MQKYSGVAIYAVFALLGGLGAAGQNQPATAAGQKQSEQPLEQVAVQSGTKITAELVSSVDARTIKPGDEVTARVTKNVKQGGKEVIRKKDLLVGHVNSVEGGAKGAAGSRLAVTFDHLVRGDSTSQLNTALSSVLSTPSQQHASPEPAAIPAPMPPMSSGGGGAGPVGGGLLGGVTSTAGSAVGAVGPAVGGLGGAVDATTQGTAGAGFGSALSTPLSAVHVGSEAQGEQKSGATSVLTSKGGPLRLESGTRLQFTVTGEADTKSQAPATK